MNPARIAELLEPFIRARPSSAAQSKFDCHSEPAKAGEEAAGLSPTQLQHISIYIDILIRWNARINLTAIRDREQIVTRHFGESLFAAAHLFPVPASVSPVGSVVKGVDSTINAHRERKEATAPANELDENLFVSGRSTLADIGSGAGFPGLPIKLWAPQISLTLIESNHKKGAFLREVTRALILTDVNIQTARAETPPPGRQRTYDVVTLRAVERFESILLTAAALVAPAGRLTLLISTSQQDQARTSLPNFTWSELVPIPNSRARALLIGTKSITSGP